MVLAILIHAASTGYANNTWFLPGDAFFYARLSQDDARHIQLHESPTFSYGNHWNGGFGCGTIGYGKIRVRNMPKASRRAVLDAYMAFKQEVFADPNLERQMSVFVYPKEYDWRKRGLGLQYNEDWVEESVVRGAGRDHVRLESFVEAPDLIVQNWRDSTLVSPLGADLPPLRKEPESNPTDTAVEIDYDKVQLLIIPNRDFEKYLRRTDGIAVIQIVGDTRATFVQSKGKWEQKSSPEMF